MHEPHAPHETIHTWKDFFIHIATIAVGLLLAIALEQTVEAVHHWHQVHTAREQIRAEMRDNLELIQRNEAEEATVKAAMIRNIQILEQHRAGKSRADRLDYTLKAGSKLHDGALHTAEATGALGLMTPDEIARYRFLETVTGTAATVALDYFSSVCQANALLQRGRSQDELLPEETDELIRLTSTVIGKLDFHAQVVGFLHGALKKTYQEESP